MLKLKNSKFFRSLLFFFSITFLLGNFNFKIALIKTTHIIELMNKDFYLNLKEKTIDNVTYLYDSPSSEEDIVYISKILNKHKDDIISSIGIKEEPHTTIRVLSKFNTSHSDSLGYVYFHNNIINVLNSDAYKTLHPSKTTKQNLNAFSETVIHEYTHSIINHKLFENKIYPNELPFWFNEGIAECMGKFAIDKKIPEFYLSNTPPSQLDSLFNINSDLFYQKSSIFVNSIIEDYGPSKIGTILNYLKYFNFEESVEKATSSSIDDISMEVFNIAYK